MFCFIPTVVSVLSKRKAFSSENIRIPFFCYPLCFCYETILHVVVFYFAEYEVLNSCCVRGYRFL